MVIVFAGFLVFLFCMYFIKNPYFTLKNIKIKRSKSLLILELFLGVIIFLYIIFAGYSRLVRFLLEMTSVVLFLLEMWLRVPAIESDFSLSPDVKAMLNKKAKKDFYSTLPMLFLLTCMFVFNFIKI
ncbi:hypothetical protein [uncultured Veillonella sp.]|uniref:hypothetical protein n=1 Tax=uncultured Veillonella sp. TaxID=159268 RepID=UPI002611CCA4|nr:hypothetical protein [uncultured Veillonella sp.]